jgi:O-acetylhomoserine/O-acetylserine sulfhydrylase-like pyridoxal-dependent enzyme
MFYGKDSIENQFSLLENKLEDLFIFEPMPSYKTGERWTDEFRIRDGHTKLADGTWVTIHKATTYFQALKKSTTELYEQHQETIRQLSMVRQQKSEMEFGLRHAQKSLNKALAMKGDSDE